MSRTSVHQETTHSGGINRPTQRWRYWTLLSILALGLGVSATPSLLYALYSKAWHFPPVVTTLIFAAYAVGALVSVLCAGPLSDRYGRKPVLIIALLLVIAGLGVFILASHPAFLIIARLVHGFGIGAIVVAAGAALLDLRPEAAALTGGLNAIAFNLGIALGAIGSAIIAQAHLALLLTPYLLLLALTLTALIAVIAMHEPHAAQPARGAGNRIHLPRPQVPAQMRGRFIFAATGAGAAWAVLGVFLSLEPAIATSAIHATGPLFSGILISVFALAAAFAQFVSMTFPARLVALIGDLASAILLLSGIGAFATRNLWLILLDVLLLGAAYGLAFSGSLRTLTNDLPAEQRGSVTSAFYLVAFGAMAIPTIVAGVAATIWSSAAIFTPFSIIATLIAASAFLFGLRLRVNPHPQTAAQTGGSEDRT
ncbi:MFS transporter [Devriesea agamarum]|uniref:MFS transporter n=1 Tax=Devriesea agamarum TaxID=472569 RepID=UPI00071E17B2